METSIVLVDAKEFGLEKTEAQKIEEVFTPMLEKMVELEKEYNEVIALEINSETLKKARDLRLRYVKVRTGTSDIHKTAKAYYLAGGRFVDAWKNAQNFSAVGKETELEKIEKHFELIEEEKKTKIAEERTQQLSQFVTDTTMYNLKEMSEEGFVQLLKSSEIAFNAQKEAEEKAEAERVEKERLEEEERIQIQAENQKLRIEAEAREAKMAKEREEALTEKAEKDKELKKLEAEKKQAEEALKAKEAEEAKKKAETKKKEKEARLAPEKDKLTTFADQIANIVLLSPTGLSEEAQKLVDVVEVKLASLAVEMKLHINQL